MDPGIPEDLLNMHWFQFSVHIDLKVKWFNIEISVSFLWDNFKYITLSASILNLAFGSKGSFNKKRHGNFVALA